MRKLSKLAAVIIALPLTFNTAPADDQPIDPAVAYAEAQAVMQRTTRQLLNHLREHIKDYSENEELLYMMLRETVLPVVDTRLISRLVLGTHWKTASKSQQERFAASFQAALIRNYGKALLLLPDIRIEYIPAAPGERPRKKYQVVRTKVMTSTNQAPLSINYSMINRQGWKVFDIIIDGTSIAKQFRDGFDQEIRETGFEALLMRLENADGAPAKS